MVNVWKIAPGGKARYWKECYDRHCIAINWLNKRNLMLFKNKGAIKKVLLKVNDGSTGSANSIWQFVREMQREDIVVANNGLSGVVGIGVVKSEYLQPDDDRNPYKEENYNRQTRLVEWRIDKPIDLHENLFGARVTPTVLRLSPEQCHKIKRAYLREYPHLKETLDQLFPPSVEETMKSLLELLEQFGQIIAYGPPGTGKTREAKRVALAMLSGKKTDENSTDDEIEKKLEDYRKDNRFDLVVFHPAYEYEQFVGGIIPRETEGKQLAFQTEPGVFLRLCRNADQHEEPVVLIIDEINRGNLPKLLGELVYALEYRGHEVTLPFECGGSRILRIPKNLYVIATMNSADRSIGHIDVAIRRRFGLLHMGARPDVVREVWQSIEEADYGNRLAQLLDELNRDLHKGDDQTAEAELGIGHSYFLPQPESSAEEAKQQVGMKWTYQVQPLLREYAQLLNLEANSLHKYFNSALESLLVQS